MDRTVDRDEKIWAFSNTGTKVHAFVQVWRDKNGVESPQHLRAMCRGTIARSANAVFAGLNDMTQAFVCPNCLKLANAMWDRAEASMQPATEADDLGYVVPVDERDNSVASVTQRIVAEHTQTIFHDAAHAEALEMDAAGEALTQAHADAITLLEPAPMPRWHYRAARKTLSGQFLGVLEGYLIADTAAEVERRVRAAEGAQHTDRWRLGNFHIRPAT